MLHICSFLFLKGYISKCLYYATFFCFLFYEFSLLIPIFSSYISNLKLVEHQAKQSKKLSGGTKRKVTVWPLGLDLYKSYLKQ